MDFAGNTTSYDNYQVHRKTAPKVLGDNGEELELALFGSIIKCTGQFKVFSYVVDQNGQRDHSCRRLQSQHRYSLVVAEVATSAAHFSEQ